MELPLQASVSALTAGRKWKSGRCPVLLGPHARQEEIGRWSPTRNPSPFPMAESLKSCRLWVAFNNVNRGPSSKYLVRWEEVNETSRPEACSSREIMYRIETINSSQFQAREFLKAISPRVEPPKSRRHIDNNSRLRKMRPVGMSWTIMIRWYLISSWMKTRESGWLSRCKTKCMAAGATLI